MQKLIPFSPTTKIQVSSEITRTSSGLRFVFKLEGINDLGSGNWNTWERGDELWRETCFEAFLRVPNQGGYWELNVSPGQRLWNLYYFTSYRNPLPPTPVPDFTLAQIEITPRSLSCELRGPAIWPSLEVNLCAVITMGDSPMQFFALSHPGPKPDFHAPDGFTLELPTAPAL